MQYPKNAVALGVVVLVVASLVTGISTTPAAADGENLTISTVAISPTVPAPNETFEVTTTIKNSEGGADSVAITDIYIRDASGLPEHERVENLGGLGDGQSMDVPLQLSFDASKDLRIHVVGRTDGGEHVHLEYPLYVEIDEADEVQLSLSTGDAVVGGDTPVDVVVANGDSDQISNVELTIAGAATTIRDNRRVSAAVDAGTDRTFEYSVTFDEAGHRPLEATLAYQTDEGYDRTVTETLTVEVDELADDVELAVETNQTDSENRMRATVTNFGNLPLEEVQTYARVDGRIVDRQASADVEPFNSSTVELDVSDEPADNVTVVSEYQLGTVSTRVEQLATLDPEPQAAIALTSVEFSQSGNVTTIRGDASNVGESDASGVIVGIDLAEDVQPVQPSKQYFVGAVDESEFGTFELTARLSDDATSLPVRVAYTDDGERRSQLVTLDLSGGLEAAQTGSVVESGDSDGSSGGMGPFALLGDIPWKVIGIGLGGSIAVLGGIFYYRRHGQ